MTSHFKNSVLTTGLCLVCSFAWASDFSDWKQQEQVELKQSKDEFTQYSDEIKAAFKEYQRKTSGVWGKKNVKPDRTLWVSYIDGLDQRSVVDFEHGSVDVEVAIPADQANDKVGKKRLSAALLKAMQQGDDKRSMQQIAKQPVTVPSGDAILAGQISKPDGTAANESDYRLLADKAAGQASRQTLRGDDGKSRVVYKTQLNLVPDHIRLRAKKFQPLVDEYSAKYSIPAPLIFAVIETESMFNPTARSNAPAFGLMQLVPTSGARDAYRYVYKKDKVVSDTYLYNPDNNIHLGTAYLAQLGDDYLSGIKSDDSRQLAAIAAYNTGAGNVMRVFVGSYSKAKHGDYNNYKRAAFAEINRRTPEQVYQQLLKHLPYHETRRYIEKVTGRMKKYAA